MALTVEEIQVIVDAEVSKAIAGFKKVDKAQTDFTKTAIKMAKTFAGPAVAGLMAKATFDFLKDASKIASVTDEEFSKMQVVFGETADEMEAWADTWAKSVGRSSSDAIKFSGDIGDLLKPLGFAKEDVDRLSKSFVELSADVASFNNKNQADVMRDFASAITGSSETVKKYGVVINQANIKAEALASGINDGTTALTAQEKAQATYQLILKGTTDAQGDLIRTQDSHANTMVRLESATKDLKIEMGKAVNKGTTPMAAATASLITKMTEWLKKTREVKEATEEIISTGESNVNQVEILNTVIEKQTALLKNQQKVQEAELQSRMGLSEEGIRLQREFNDEQNKGFVLAIEAAKKQIRDLAALETAKEFQIQAELRYADAIAANDAAAAALAKTEAEAAAVKATGIADTIFRQEKQLELTKSFLQIEEQVKVGLIEGNGEREKQAALIDTLNELIEEGFRAQGPGFANIIAAAKVYGVELENLNDIAEDDEVSESLENQLKKWAAVDAAAKKSAAGTVEAGNAWSDFIDKTADEWMMFAADMLSSVGGLFSSLSQLAKANGDAQIAEIDRILARSLEANELQFGARIEGLQKLSAEEQELKDFQRAEEIAKLQASTDEEDQLKLAAMLAEEQRLKDLAKAVEEKEKADVRAKEVAEKKKSKIQYEAALGAWQLQILSTVANGAAAIVMGFAQLGPIGGAIAAAFTIATTAVSLGIMAANKPKKTFAAGGTLTTNGPETILVGDNPGGQETVTVTPTSSPNVSGPSGGSMMHLTINLDGQPIYDGVTEASRDGRLIISTGSIV